LSDKTPTTWLTKSPTWWTESAQQYARAGRLEEWIYAYLATDGWNDALLKRLRRQQRWWRGPIETAHADLVRICGPESHMEYRVDTHAWERHVSLLQQGLPNNRLRVPPLIVEYRGETLIICDGAHRYEAMRRLGWQTCWIVIWYDSEEQFIADNCRWTARTPVTK
jgi:hypothetical protein